jgi:hypothetical protein
MEARGGSRDSAVNRTMEDMSTVDDIPIIQVRSPTPSIVSAITSRTPPPEPGSPPPNGHRRGNSESQNLLPPSPKNLFEYSTTREFRYSQPENSVHDGRVSPSWGGVARTVNKTRQQKWRDAFVDILAVSAGLPFFALAGAIIRLDEKPVKGYQENILNQCIKGVSTKIPAHHYLLILCRPPHYSLSCFPSLWAELWSSSRPGRSNEGLQ